MKTAQKILKRSQKGFTLIELLVVIAVLGVLAAVVLIAIDPVERLNEGKDSGTKNNVAQVANAAESCFTVNSGVYTACDTLGELQGSFLKATTTLNDTVGTLIAVAVDSGSAANILVSGQIKAKSAGCAAVNAWWVYRSISGQSAVVCSASRPTT